MRTWRAADTGRPPPPPFGLTVGITGHRADAIPSAALPLIQARLGGALDRLRQEALAILERERGSFADQPPRFTLVSPLASGADQLAARLALERNWDVQTVLPMAAENYRELDPAAARHLPELMERSRCVLQLPSNTRDPDQAFVLTARATVAHCDLLIAVWDGLPARGRGGTAETVDVALTRGTPVLHIPLEVDAGEALMWSAFDPVVITAPGDACCRRKLTPALLRAVLEALLAPPAARIERNFIQRFLGERDRSLRLRVEYPLLMMLMGTKRLSRKDISARPQQQAIAREWRDYREACLGRHGVEAPLDELELAYGWSDRLATHYSQTYRSSHVLNFLLAALGAWIGLSGLVLDANPLALALAEFAVVLVVVVNTVTGSRRCWHQRWLDYRQLAERLRPMRSLKLLGIAAPDPPGSAAEPVARRWIDWYAAAIWRTVGCPAGAMTPVDVQRLASAMSARELQPQIDYNRRSAGEAERLDARLEVAGLSLFIATLLVTVGVIVGLEFRPDLVRDLGNWTTVFSAGLPALGTAIFGIRVQGDYGAAAARSRTTAALLERIARELSGTGDLGRAADLMEQAGRVMLSDLGEWRLVNELHELSLG